MAASGVGKWASSTQVRIRRAFSQGRDAGADLILGHHRGEGCGDVGGLADDRGDLGEAGVGGGQGAEHGEAAEAGDEAPGCLAVDGEDLDGLAQPLGQDRAAELGEGLGVERAAVTREGGGVDGGYGEVEGGHGARAFRDGGRRGYAGPGLRCAPHGGGGA